MKSWLRRGVQRLGPICHLYRHWGVRGYRLRRSNAQQRLGLRGERAARKYLARQGWRMLVTRSLELLGELDLVAEDDGTIVFVEVKTRRSYQAGLPAEGVDHAKQVRLARLALLFLKRHRLLEYPVRFDVVGVMWPAGSRKPTIEHYRNAFPSPLRDPLWG